MNHPQLQVYAETSAGKSKGHVIGSAAYLLREDEFGAMFGLFVSAYPKQIKDDDLVKGDQYPALQAREIVNDYYDSTQRARDSFAAKDTTGLFPRTSVVMDSLMPNRALEHTASSLNELWTRTSKQDRSVNAAILHIIPSREEGKIVGYAVNAATIGIDGVWKVNRALKDGTIARLAEKDFSRTADANAIGPNYGAFVKGLNFAIRPDERAVLSMGIIPKPIRETTQAVQAMELDEALRLTIGAERAAQKILNLGNTALSRAVIVIDCQRAEAS